MNTFFVFGQNSAKTTCDCPISDTSGADKNDDIHSHKESHDKIDRIIKDVKVKKKERLTYKIKELTNEADFHFEVDESYDRALPVFLKAYALNPSNAQVTFKVGKCYIYSQHSDIDQAIIFLEKAHKLDKEVHKEIRYYLGVAYHINSVWDNAIENYTIFLVSIPVKEIKKKQEVEKKIRECNIGKMFENNTGDYAQTNRILISKMPKGINSEFSDFCPVIAPNGNTLYFTSRREDSHRGIVASHFDHYEDIYYSEKEGESWSSPKPLADPFNSRGHDATACISPDGSKMIIYRDGDLYESDFDDRTKEWNMPLALSKNINSKYSETSACFSPDGNTLYFVSDRKENSFGGLDIFKSELQDDGSWGKAVNLGENINSSHNEEGIFVHPNNKALIFSSEGHDSMGGYDLFKSELGDDGNWTKAKNMGLPLNSPGDDVFLVLDKTGKKGFYTSSRKGSLGNKDIYSIAFLGKKKEPLMNLDAHLISSSEKSESERTKDIIFNSPSGK